MDPNYSHNTSLKKLHQRNKLIFKHILKNKVHISTIAVN